MSKKTGQVAELIEKFKGQHLEAHYLAYFSCFNRGLFYEAHDVLEELWLPSRNGPLDRFYKGLIQLAGAFVHLQKDRLKPAAALLRLAQSNLLSYPEICQQLDLARVLILVNEWLQRLEADQFSSNPLRHHVPPELSLQPGAFQTEKE